MVDEPVDWDGRYVALLTYRRDGTATACPVWCARVGQTLLFRTFAKTLKARRLERDPRVGLAPCQRDGSTTIPYVHGRARQLSGRAALAAGWRLTQRQGPIKPLADLYYRFTLGRVLTFAVDLDACQDQRDVGAAPKPEHSIQTYAVGCAAFQSAARSASTSTKPAAE